LKPKSETLQKLAETAERLGNSATRSWKEQGGRVMGYFCSAVPEELFTAAGFLPFRIRATGSTGTELSDAHFSNLNCSFVRHCFNVALLGEYDFLDGVVLINSCDNLRRIYDHWRRQLTTPFVRIMSFPRKTGPPQVDWYQKELAELRDAEGIADHRARLMVLGSILDDPEYLRVIESQGGLVVTDSTCFGSRIMWKDVRDEGEDPIHALAQYYVADRHSCPRTFGEHERRAEFVREMVREFKVDGVVGERLSFCDQWGFAQYSIESDMKENGTPYLPLEREYILSGVGQLRTRIQAFLETLGR